MSMQNGWNAGAVPVVACANDVEVATALRTPVHKESLLYKLLNA
jgi:hypothetical protein